MSDAPRSLHPPARRPHRHQLPHLLHPSSNAGLHCLCLLLLMSTLCSAVSVTSGTSGHNRRRSGGSGLAGAGSHLTSLEDTGDKSVPDQLALAASRRGSDDRSYPRRGSVIHSRTKEQPSKDYSYGQVELNLVRPEQESHPKLLLRTTTAASGPGSGLDGGSANPGAAVHLEDSRSAAEYVANAIKLAYNQPPVQIQLKTPIQVQATSTQRSYNEQREREREQQLELQLQKELEVQQQQQQKQQLQQQQQQQQQVLLLSSAATASSSLNASPALVPAPVYEKEPVTRSYDLYEGSASSTEAHNRGLVPVQEEIERHYRPKYHSSSSSSSSNNYNYGQYPYRNLEAEAEEKVRVSASTEIPKSEIMKQIEKSVIKYMKELEAEGKILSTPQEPVTPPPPPPPPQASLTKTYYKTQPVSVSSSSLLSSLEDKRYSSSTMRPKYTAAPAPAPQQQSKQQIHQVYHQHPVQQQQHHQITSSKVRSTSQKPLLQQQQHFQSETETAYQAPDLPVDELSPNVEFIYKIKTRAPLQTATVKTVSKPYTLPLKSADHFDHGAALKNIEEFDLSHVVPTPERESSREDLERSKPHKLYFNSEIYHDINSLPYKSKEAAAAAAALHEYQRHKLKASSVAGSSSEHLHPDYKGYGGYFAEPEPAELENDSKLMLNEEGYHREHLHHHHHPYHHYHVLKKETLEEHEHDHDHDSWLDQQSNLRLANAHAHALGHGQGHVHVQAQNQHGHSTHGHGHGHSHSQHPAKHQSLDYDSYSPKFNNNPEGYGYQHTYKGSSRGPLQQGQGQGQGQGLGIASPGTGSSKRGKRGGGAHPRQEAIKKQLRASEVKDLEANLALRPPPK